MTKKVPPASSVNIRYIVNDVAAAVAFYRETLGFTLMIHAPPGFAMLSRGNLRLLLNKPGAGGSGQTMPDGTMPTPGGWNRLQLTVENLEQVIETLKTSNVTFRNELVTGQGGKQILVQDPSGNLVELFEPVGR